MVAIHKKSRSRHFCLGMFICIEIFVLVELFYDHIVWKNKLNSLEGQS